MKNTKKDNQKEISLLGLSGKRMVGGVLVEWNPLAYLNQDSTSYKIYYR
jgi:hypothetical protein